MSAPLFHMIASASEPIAPFSHGVEQDGWVFVTALSNSCVLRRSPGKKVGEGSCAYTAMVEPVISLQAWNRGVIS